MRAIVINRCDGGFCLSQAAKELLAQRKNVPVHEFDFWNYDRDDVDLVAVVRELGAEVNGVLSNLKIVEIPEDVMWEIAEDDYGYEWVQEVHRRWY